MLESPWLSGFDRIGSVMGWNIEQLCDSIRFHLTSVR